MLMAVLRPSADDCCTRGRMKGFHVDVVVGHILSAAVPMSNKSASDC